MKKAVVRGALIGILLTALLMSACPDGNNGDDKGPFRVTFDGGYGGASAISPIMVDGGAASGSRWPADPMRLGFTFDGWFAGSQPYDAQTLIKKDVTVTAQWSAAVSKLEDQPSAAELEALFNALPAELSNSWKIWGHHNALITQGFGADPTAFEYNNRLYLFASNDSLLYDESGQIANGTYGTGIQGLRALSSADLVNWTDHGVINIHGPDSTNPLIPVSEPIGGKTYATASWAPSATWKMISGRPRFFIYYANTGNGIGVITADSPTGPWRAPLNKLLIDRDTPNCADVANLFDPGVMVDDDGAGYLFFGGGGGGQSTMEGRRVQLAPDMLSIIGEPETFDPPFLFEDNEIIKINGLYFYSYVTNAAGAGMERGQIAYMTADHPMGTFSAPRGIMRIASSQLGSDDNNNHHCIFQFKDNYYIAYHASRVKYAMGANKNAGYYRSAHIDNVTVNADSSIAAITMTSEGVAQVGKFDPYLPNEAESIGIMGGIFTRAVEGASNGMVVTAIDTGDWVGVYGVDFGGDGANQFVARVRTPDTPDDYTGGIELRLDPDGAGSATGINNISVTNTARIEGGEVIGRLQIKAKPGEAGQFTTVTIDLDRTVTGIHNLVFVFYSSLGSKPITADNMRESHHQNGFEFDQWQFIK